MPGILPGSVHFDKVLTNISIAYMQDTKKFIADRVFPIVEVEKQSDKVLRYSREYWYRIQAGLRAPASESRGGGFEIGTLDTYFCNVHAFHIDVPLETFKNSDIPNLERQVTEAVTYQLLLDRELEWVRSYFDDTGKTPGVDFWTRRVGGTDFTKWSAPGGTPLTDIIRAIDDIERMTGFAPNTIVMGKETFRVLRENPQIQAQVVYAPGAAPDVRGLVTPELLAQLFGVSRVFIGSAAFDPGREGTPLAPRFMFEDNLLLVYVPERPGLLTPTGGYIFAWTGFNEGYYVGTSVIEIPTRKAFRYEGEMAYDTRILGPDLGVFFKDVA